MIHHGKRLAFDFGSKRIGVAIADADGLVAVPLMTLINDETLEQSLFELFADYAPVMAYVGMATHLSGHSGSSAEACRNFALQIMREFEIPVYLIDERLSSTSAAKQLTAIGKSPSRNKKIIDQIAATTILESALNFEKSHGRYAGTPV